MRQTIFGFVFCVSWISPASSDWVQFDQTENMVVYLDLETVTQSGPDIWIIDNLVDFYLPQVAHPVNESITFQSFVRRIEIDCAKRRQKTLDIVFYERVGAGGSEVFRAEINSTWKPTPPGMGNALLVDMVCHSRT